MFNWEIKPLDTGGEEQPPSTSQATNNSTIATSNPLDTVMLMNQKMLELQGKLVETIAKQKLKFIPFDPTLTDPDVWLKTAKMIVKKLQPDSADFVSALTESMRGTATLWLSNIMEEGLEWTTFETLFRQQYCKKETPAALVHKLITHYFKEEEFEKGLSEYYPKIKGIFKNKPGIECADILMSAVAGKADGEIRRWIYKEENPNELTLFKEVASVKASRARGFGGFKNVRGGFTQRGSFKRKNVDTFDQPASKQPKVEFKTTTPNMPDPTKRRFCQKCNLNNHDWAFCKFNPNRILPRGPGTSQQRFGPPNLQPSGSSGMTRGPGGPRQPGYRPQGGQQAPQRHVNACAANPAGNLSHRGNTFQYIFDSGSEVSLLNEKLLNEFEGQKYTNPIILTGIGNKKTMINTQISTMITIDNIEIPILFHIVPNGLISFDILIGRDIIDSGILITVSHDKYEIKRVEDKDKKENKKLSYLKSKSKLLKLKNKNRPVKIMDDSLDEDKIINKPLEENIMPIPCVQPIVDLEVESLKGAPYGYWRHVKGISKISQSIIDQF